MLLCLVGQRAFAQATDTTAQIDKLFSSWNNSTPGGSILVARGENILYQKAYGLANLESKVPNTTETIFEAGSVSKQFTAFSILLLNAEGKLNLGDDVRKYVPELPVYEAPITIQHLLNHTSGLKDWGSVGALTGWPRGSRDYTLPLALHIMCKQKTTNFKPGNEYSYSNSNYTMLTIIVERVSKQSLEDFTKERLFKPLGMNSTRWRSNFRDVIPNRAQAYSERDNGYQLEMPFEHIYGHGGLLTTTGDLLKWNQLLETHKLGGDAVFNKRLEHGKLNDGKPIAYAAGIQHGEVNGIAEIEHSGATAGYRAWLAYYPTKKLTVVLLSNEANFPPVDMGHQVAEIYFGKKKEVENSVLEPGNSPAVLKPGAQSMYDLTGRYYSEEAECSYLIEKLSTGELTATNEALQTFPLERESDLLYKLNGAPVEFQLTKKIVTGFNISVSRANKVPFKKTK